MDTSRRQSRRRRRNQPEASYDEASRARWGRTGGGGTQAAGSDRFSVVLALLAVVALVVFGKLFWIQVVQHDYLTQQAMGSRSGAEVTVHGMRGTIYDRNGNVLAKSVECQTVCANPKMVNDPGAVAQILADTLGGKKSDYMSDLTADTTFVYLAKRVDQSLADTLSSRLEEAGLEGVFLESDTKRVYPYGTYAQQILGFVGADGQALSGIELQYDDILRGTDGTMLREVGAGGIPIVGGVTYVDAAQDGQDIVLSIDIDLQAEVEDIIRQAPETYQSDSASAMVTNPKTGEILAACSTPLPDFDNLTDVASLSLKVVSDAYEPGSVFKVITTSIGFDLGLYTPTSIYNIPVTVLAGDDYVTDDDSRDYAMDMTITEMMRRSSNVAMATLSQSVIGPEAFATGVERYGIGSLTGIDFPGEAEGIVRSYAEYDGSTAGNMGFGQGLAIPMVQIVRVYGAVANDGVPITPHFLISQGGEEVSWPSSQPIMSKEASDMETVVMRAVMTDGTGTNGQVEGYDIAGKTGTGEQAGEDGTYKDGSYVASLCGFANADDPEVLVYVGVNGTDQLALSSAAHVFHDVMAQSVSILSIAPAS